MTDLSHAPNPSFTRTPVPGPEPELPRRIPSGIVAPFVVVAFLLWTIAGYVFDDPVLGTAAAVLGCLLLALGGGIESMALSRRRAHIYRDLRIAIPAELARGMYLRLGPIEVLMLVMAGYFVVAGLNSVRPLPDWVLLGALAVFVATPFVGGYFWLRHRAALRLAAVQHFAHQQGLELEAKTKFGQERRFVLYGGHDGRQVQVHTNGQVRVAVLVEEFEGEGIWLVPATWRNRRAARRAGNAIRTGDAPFDLRFLVRSEPPARGLSYFDDADLRRALLSCRELGSLYLVLGGNGLLLNQDYPRADANYLAALRTIAVSLARRWDGRASLDFPV